jgi:predicted AAA+ superfamily ATPase
VPPADPAYTRRIADDELDVLLAELPAIVIEGPKGVGKTAAALQRAATVHQLDDPAQRELARADMARLIAGDPPVLLDEWQFVPESWDQVRRAVDAEPARAGRFLLTGSAWPNGVATHSGAARIVTVRMRPMALSERGLAVPTVSLAELLSGRRPAVGGSTDVTLEDYVGEILASGFPGLRGYRERALRAQLDSYLSRIVDRDFPELGHSVRNPAALRRWMVAYAAASSTTMSYEKIRDAATAGHANKPAKTTTIPYRDVLERLWVVEPVEAWSPSRNQITRLGSPPKHQLADPALAARLLGVTAGQLLAGADVGPPIPRDGTLLGALFESLVTLDVRIGAQAAEAKVKHLRTHSGDHEVDLVVERGDGRVVGIEVKLGRTPPPGAGAHLHWLEDRIGDELLDKVIVTTGPEAYRRQDGVAVVPAALLGP